MKLRQCVFVCKDLESSREELCDILGIEKAGFEVTVAASGWMTWNGSKHCAA